MLEVYTWARFRAQSQDVKAWAEHQNEFNSAK